MLALLLFAGCDQGPAQDIEDTLEISSDELEDRIDDEQASEREGGDAPKMTGYSDGEDGEITPTLPLEFLSALENLVDELESRDFDGELPHSLREALYVTKALREAQNVERVIDMLNAGASPEDVLEIDAMDIEDHFAALAPVMDEVQQLRLEKRLDPVLAGHEARIMEIDQQSLTTTSSTAAKKTYCCKVTLINGSQNCYQWRTYGWWALKKCSEWALVPGTSWTLYSGECSNYGC